ncbi:hypothetical protein [Tessaracoccus sp.]
MTKTLPLRSSDSDADIAPRKTLRNALLHDRARDRLTAIGWTAADWDDLMDASTWEGPADHQDIQWWLENPPLQFAWHPITPTQFRETCTRYGKNAGYVLSAYAEGAAPRFVDVFIGAGPVIPAEASVMRARLAWMNAKELRLSEDQAVGWAHADLLIVDLLRTPDGVPVITTWIARFGPTAYLWVLAGYTLDEATAMQDAGTVITDDQLRVAVTLKGITLPAGI